MNSSPYNQILRARQLIARLRHLQLEAALKGRVQASFRYAHRAQRIRRMLQQESKVVLTA